MLRLCALGFVMTAVLSACAPSQPEVVRPAGSPVYPPTQFVDLLEAPPARPFVEIGFIDIPPEPGNLRSQALAQLRTRAQQLGADAVIVQDLSRLAPVVSRLNPTTGMYENTGGQLVPAFKGTAIKYK
jgi:hypothetical protein